MSSSIHRTWIADAPIVLQGRTFYSGVHRSKIGDFGEKNLASRCPEGIDKKPLNLRQSRLAKKGFSAAAASE